MAEIQPEPSEPDLSGKQLGDYRLLRRLGRGGMAEVYLAEQTSLRRQVAFKVLKSSLADDKNYVRRFHNEAQAAASLVHANIVQIHEVGFVGGVHFIAQEYVPGQNLQQLLSRRGSLDAKSAASIMRQVGAALLKAGERGIIHRDIKPENIMLASSGEVKVADFGLARVTGNGEKVDLTQIGVTMGTPLYMSPEQVEGRVVDPRSDLYSLGVTCYQMLAGRPPFEGDTALSIALKHLKTEPARLEELRPDLPPGLCCIVHKMLAKEPAQRYQRSAELLRDLRALQIEGPEADWPSGVEQWTSSDLAADGARFAATQQLATVMRTEAQQTRRRYRRWLLAALAILASFGLGAAAAWMNRPASLLYVDPADLPKVERMESARSQYYHATLVNSEAAWKAVADYFPPERDSQSLYYSRLAKKGLAELYLRDENFSQALRLFNELASLEPTEDQFRTYGFAGQVLVYRRLGEHDKVKAILPHILDKLHYLDRDTRATIEQMADQYREQATDASPSPTN